MTIEYVAVVDPQAYLRFTEHGVCGCMWVAAITFNRRSLMDGNDPARCWGAVLAAKHLLSTHKGVSEVGCNAAC